VERSLILVSKVDLRIDWATHEAAKYACENWHYSGCIPKSKLVKVGVWEGGVFIGVVIFGSGASPQIGRPYKLASDEVCELVRIALKSHKTPVSKILSIALKFLLRSNPKLRLIVSYADPIQGHHGGVYQATNWIYSGKTNPCEWFKIVATGQLVHSHSYRRGRPGRATRNKAAGLIESVPMVKHKYLMPLDDEMKQYITPLSKPYPKRTKEQASEFHSDLGGATPTCTLHSLQDAT
jgi:hypothetical protein